MLTLLGNHVFFPKRVLNVINYINMQNSMKNTQKHNPSLLLNKTVGATFAGSYSSRHLSSIESHTLRIATIDIQKVKEINWN